MVTMSTVSEAKVLVPGWVTTDTMANMLGLRPDSFRVWLNSNKGKIREHRLGHTSIISIADVYRLREGMQ